MKAVSLLVLLVTSACGSTAKNVPEPTSSTLTTASVVQPCAWVANTYDFATYSDPSKTPPTPGEGLTWQIKGTLNAVNVDFLFSFDIDENNAPWVSIKTASGLEQEVCPTSIDVGTSRLTFRLTGEGWLQVDATNADGTTQTWWTESGTAK